LMCAGINGAADDLRLFCRIKGAIVEGIETSRIEWHKAGASDTTKSADKVVKLPLRADAWLREYLASGPRDGGELKAAAASAGIHHNNLYRAVKRLGVEISGNGFGRPRIWRLRTNDGCNDR
ncbi:MAG: hypothetical protein P8Y67_13550, partial [Alphaproteobacteria bacterium]